MTTLSRIEEGYHMNDELEGLSDEVLLTVEDSDKLLAVRIVVVYKELLLRS